LLDETVVVEPTHFSNRIRTTFSAVPAGLFKGACVPRTSVRNNLQHLQPFLRD
jgi:hypothetical protein